MAAITNQRVVAKCLVKKGADVKGGFQVPPQLPMPAHA
jgi:hypothetical protein